MINNIIKGIRELSLQEIDDMDIISQSQFDNLIAEDVVRDDDMRIMTRTWISRMTVLDGAKGNNEVTVEIFINGDLKGTYNYFAK